MNLLFPTKNIELNLGETITFDQVTGKLEASRIEGDLPAEQGSYDNTESGLEATNVQDAIDEVNAKIEDIPSVDAYTKEQADDKFATKTALQTVANAVDDKADATEIAPIESGDSVLVEKGYFTDAQKNLNGTVGYDTVKYHADKSVLVGSDVRSESGTEQLGINFRDFGLDSSNAIVEINNYPYLVYKLDSDIPQNVNITLTIWFYTSSMSQYTETITITTRNSLVFFNLKEYAETVHRDRYYKYAFVVACTSASFSFSSAFLTFSMYGFFDKKQIDNYNLNIRLGTVDTDINKIKNTLVNGVIEPQKTSFFTGSNYFNIGDTQLLTGVFVGSNGRLAISSSNGNTIITPVKPNTEYYLHIPSNNAGRIIESETGFILGDTYNLLYSEGATTGAYHFTTGANTHFVAVYFYSGIYDYNTNKYGIILNEGQYYNGENPFIPYDYLPWDISNVLKDAQVLIFGDSITDSCSISVDENNRTSAYSWRNPSLSYVNEHGDTIGLSKWAKILNESQPIKEVRNYALSGASYRTESRSAGNERQNLQYQIDLALNDVDNPNNVFAVDHFEPNIVIFALGTNDGIPNDNFASAMNKTILKSDGYSIDTDATLLNLDETKFCESMRKAFMRIEQAFPTAQRFCVIPIQKASEEANETKNLYISQMAERYGCVIINGYATSGITRDFNNRQALGTLLIDTLHPNEKGQNMMARMIISSLKAHYIPFGLGFNS